MRTPPREGRGAASPEATMAPLRVENKQWNPAQEIVEPMAAFAVEQCIPPLHKLE
jgi:hypothetical protein